jgi:hypothetical protein
MVHSSLDELSPCNLPLSRTSLASALQEARHRRSVTSAAAHPNGDHRIGTMSQRRHEVRSDDPRAERLQFIIDVLDEALAISFEDWLPAKPAITSSKTFAGDQ